jgi:hypothetical protein
MEKEFQPWLNQVGIVLLNLNTFDALSIFNEEDPNIASGRIMKFGESFDTKIKNLLLTFPNIDTTTPKINVATVALAKLPLHLVW